MAYKPPMKESGYTRGASGIAKVSLNKDKTKAKVQFEDGEPIVVGELPKNVHGGTVYVTLNSEETEMVDCRPVNGLFIGGRVELVSKEGEEPEPKTKTYKYEGKDITYQYFIALVTIMKGDWKGTKIPIMLRYHFDVMEDTDGKTVLSYNHPKSKYTPFLQEFCDVTGVWSGGRLPYRDNALPMLQSRIGKAKKQFQFFMKNGFVDSFMPLEGGLKSEEIPEEDIPF